MLGYSFLINPNIHRIRHQILHPEQKILPVWGIRESNDLPDNLLGVNIIYQPKELCAFFVIFELKFSNRANRYGVVLPGPTAPGMKVYESISMQRPEQSVTMSVINIPEIDYLSKPELAFISHLFWKEAISRT